MTEDIRDELRSMGLYPPKTNTSCSRPESPGRSKQAAISSKASRWIGRDGKPEIPYKLESNIRK